jgi:hypothetical protein
MPSFEKRLTPEQLDALVRGVSIDHDSLRFRSLSRLPNTRSAAGACRPLE